VPQSVYERKSPEHPEQNNWVPEGWAYIGQTVTSNASDVAYPITWNKIKVLNRAGNNWVLLNADLDKVDYTLTGLSYDRFLIDISDHLNEEFGSYTLTITPKPTTWGSTTTELADDTDTYWITGLLPSTAYTVNIVANLNYGGTTNGSVQTITTSANPPPLPPVLTYTAASNIDIDLAWTDPAGSSATSYRVYAGIGWGEPWAVGYNGLGVQQPTANRYWRCTSLGEDLPYYYQVAGINANGLEGPRSNRVQVHTGHASSSNTGGFTDEPLWVWETGSWRNDIGWYDWHYWPNRVWQDSVFQGYWEKGVRLYRGCITYNVGDFRNRLNSRWGAGTWENLNVTGVSLRRVYRMRAPGNYDRQYMVWHLTNTDIFNTGEPPRYGSHRNNYDSPDAWSGHDAMKAGEYFLGLRLPRYYGKAIVAGHLNGTPVNGVVLFRDDGQNNGYGTNGYGEWCGHGQYDRAYSDPWRYSDWTMNISAEWSVLHRAYQPPYA
jgi:hypothetical protein